MQNSFQHQRAIGYRINKTAHDLKNNLASLFKQKKIHITVEQWQILNILWVEEGINQTTIASKAIKDKTNLTRTLDVMEKNKMIIRHSDQSDRRVHLIFLTDYGRELKDKLIPIALELNQIAFKGFKEEELALLERFLDRIQKNLDEREVFK